MKSKLVIDSSIGEQPFIKIKSALSKDGNGRRFQFTITKPEATELMPPVVIENPVDSTSVSFVVSKAMASAEHLSYGYNNAAYLWEVNKWIPADNWMKTLSHSMHGLMRTGEYSSKSSRCFYNTMRSAWASSARPTLELKPFGNCSGIPLLDGVLNVIPREHFGDMSADEMRLHPSLWDYETDTPKEHDSDLITGVGHTPADGAMHVLPVKVMDVVKEFYALASGERNDSLLLSFLRSSLDPDQRLVLQRWFGLHLVVHRVGNPHKMLFMHGPGGNGKGVVVGLLSALLTDDAVATLNLKDLTVSSNLELLVGKRSMIGAEGTAVTDNEVLKLIVAWEGLNVNPKYRDPFKIIPQCLVTQASNPPPHFDDDSDAMVRRTIALEMLHQPKLPIIGLVERVKKDEYALLVAWAMQGALDVLRAGTIVVPESVATYSAQVVRPIRPVDRFVSLLECGQFEVADDELYAAYTLNSKRQGLAISPKDEFLADLCKRLDRAGVTYLRRSKVTGYQAQRHINDQQKSVALVPQLLEAKSTDLFFGFRIAEGPFGPAIGTTIPDTRRGIPEFV